MEICIGERLSIASIESVFITAFDSFIGLGRFFRSTIGAFLFCSSASSVRGSVVAGGKTGMSIMCPDLIFLVGDKTTCLPLRSYVLR